MHRLRITRQFIRRAFGVAVAAVIANVIVLGLARAAFPAPAAFSPYFYSSVIELTAAGVVAAAAVYVVMGLIFRKRDRNKDFVWVSFVALVLSFVPDILLPFSSDADNQGATWPIVGVLMLLHVIPAVMVIWGFTSGVKDVSSHG
ncbi:MAG: hypothetical protein KGI69_01760 [Patescibacteria group bacterium]|nr:hypothetical protein [Patescibacteria group bacterium]